jgi:ribosomal protein S15
MSITESQEVSALRLHEKDTGSADVQIAILTKRINELTEHLKSHAKDHSSRRGLLKLVAQRRSLLDYLKDESAERYQKVLQSLNLRKTIETGKIAKLADGAVMVRCGETIILVTAVSATKIKEGQDFFPLTVEYKEKAAAAGKFPGGYFKREGRPTEKGNPHLRA